MTTFRMRVGMACFGAFALAAGIASLATSMPTARAAAALEKFPISLVRVSASSTTWWAEQQGYFKDVGLDIDEHLFDSGNDAILAVSAGSVTVGVSTNAASAFNVAGKGLIKLIGSHTGEAPGFRSGAYIVTNAAYDSGVHSVKDLKGKRVGLTATGSGTYYSLGKALEKYGLTFNDIVVVPLQTQSNIQAAFRGGQIDAAIIGPPFSVTLEQDHVGHIVGWAGDIDPWQIGAIFAYTDDIPKQRPEITKFMKALARGATDVNKAFNQLDAQGNVIKGPNYDAILTLTASKLGVPPKNLEGALGYIYPDLKLQPDDIRAQVAFWKKLKAVDASVDADKIMDTSFTQ